MERLRWLSGIAQGHCLLVRNVNAVNALPCMTPMSNLPAAVSVANLAKRLLLLESRTLVLLGFEVDRDQLIRHLQVTGLAREMHAGEKRHQWRKEL